MTTHTYKFTTNFSDKGNVGISVINKLKKLVYKFATNFSIKGNMDNFCYR